VAEKSNCVHHVVWCVRPESLEPVRRFWQQAVGLPLQDLDLPELGLHVLISWEGGVEVMSPVHETGTLVDPARRFLASHGEGVYCVVFNVAGLEDVVARISGQGGRLVFEETIQPDEVAERELGAADSPERFAIRQALFDPICGLRICLQELTPAAR
jgi:predicted enzyme related to lactoylglutathione lyase